MVALHFRIGDLHVFFLAIIRDQSHLSVTATTNS